jgi:hypothetical protein
MERVQRSIALIAGLLTLAGLLYGTFHDPDPWDQRVWVIVFRLVWSALILSLFLQRVAGKRMDTFMWGIVALLVVPEIWDAKTALGAIILAIAVALILVAARIEHLLKRHASTNSARTTPETGRSAGWT